jgi:hypothetical protein
MTEHLLAKAKAYVALIGSLATALLALYGPDTQVGHILTVVVALATAFSVHQVPNTPRPVTPYHEGN